MAQSSLRSFEIGYRVLERANDAAWDLPEESLPQSVPHEEAVDLLFLLLSFWAASVGDTFVAKDLAVRWNEQRPAVGVDPDVAVYRPVPPNARDLSSIRTWTAGHAAPQLAIEVVSNTNPRKDYLVAPEKYAASGTSELWIFDPLLAGPGSHGGPFRLQLWTRNATGAFMRSYAGDGPVLSPFSGAWLIVTDEGRKLRLAKDEAATDFWMTGEEHERAAKEQERAAKEQERAAKEQERAAKEAALARIAELEAELAKRG